MLTEPDVTLTDYGLTILSDGLTWALPDAAGRSRRPTRGSSSFSGRSTYRSMFADALGA